MRAFLRAGLVGLALLLAAPAAGQDYQKGLEAYNNGDYATALREWRPLAEQGHAGAQYNLGNMYDKGMGVPQDYIQAHMWWNLAAAQGGLQLRPIVVLAVKNRDLTASRMTPADISKAQRLAKEWLEKHPQ